MRNHCLLCEDAHGFKFFQKLVQRLKEAGIIPESINVKEKKHTNGMINPRNPKVRRVIAAMLSNKSCDKVIVLLDADGRGAEKVEKEFREKQRLKSGKVVVVVFETEVEEWITASLGVNERDPSTYLKEHYGYRKSELPSKAEGLDLKQLSGVASFERFVEALKDP